jgi:hypothetical protein
MEEFVKKTNPQNEEAEKVAESDEKPTAKSGPPQHTDPYDDFQDLLFEMSISVKQTSKKGIVIDT